jgi:hypothetical protein
MSLDNDEWYYGDNNQRNNPSVDAGGFMRGEGFDEENDIYRDGAENKKQTSRATTETCTCQLDGMFTAAQLLQVKLSNNPTIFPETSSQMDSFAQVGGYASGPWYKWVNSEHSRVTNKDEFGFIELGANCNITGHRCRIRMISETEFVIDGMPADAILSEIGKPIDISDDFELVSENNPFDTDEPALTDEEESDEDAQKYDERTYGDLDDSLESPLDHPDRDLATEWRESAYSDDQIATYISVDLNVERVAYLSRFMPVHHVTAWIEQFGEDSMDAISMLQIALGGLHKPDREHPDPFDRAMEKLVDDIRKQTAKRFKEFKTGFKRAEDATAKRAKDEWAD